MFREVNKLHMYNTIKQHGCTCTVHVLIKLVEYLIDNIYVSICIDSVLAFLWVQIVHHY